jgi:CHAT domain-containing protein
VHFNGHAYFNDQRPRDSGLVLHDQDMKTGAVVGFFGKRPPVLCFINACETARVGKWNERYDIFGLARAFLETGTYLLGSRWRINDKAAAEFATNFYSALIGNGRAVGTAMLEARRLSKTSGLDEFAWASYMYYGDPRMCFRRLG